MNEKIEEILDFKEDADYKRLSVDEIKLLRYYITKLLNKIEDYELYDNQEIERLNNIIKELTQENLKRSDKIDELLEIKNKSIDYIEEKGRLKYKPDELLNILKGDSSNE